MCFVYVVAKDKLHTKVAAQQLLLPLSVLMSVSSCPAGLQILFTLLQNVSGEEAAAQSFYQTYFCDVLQHIFSVVTDTSHTAGKGTDVMVFGACAQIKNEPIKHVLFNVKSYLVSVVTVYGDLILLICYSSEL